MIDIVDTFSSMFCTATLKAFYSHKSLIENHIKIEIFQIRNPDFFPIPDSNKNPYHSENAFHREEKSMAMNSMRYIENIGFDFCIEFITFIKVINLFFVQKRQLRLFFYSNNRPISHFGIFQKNI